MGWTPAIGDPKALAWLTVVLYFAAAVLCVVAARQTTGEARWFWSLLIAIMLALGINKQLDLQSLLTQLARENARNYDWYEARRAVQAVFLVALGVGSCILLIVLAIVLRHHGRAVALAVFGIAWLTVFVVGRAASFHHIDRMLGWMVGGMAMNAVLEMGGILLVATGAMLAAARRA